MTQSAARHIARSILSNGAAGLLLLLASGAYCQVTSPCTVETLRMRITTGGDDLRGGKDNLNVSIRWGTNGFQGVANVNKSANWPNGSEHLVDVRLNQPVPLSEIKSITLDHMAGGGLTVSAQTVLSPIGVLAGIQSPDNWDMASLEVTAVGQGIGVVILRHGAKKFTGSDPVLNLRTEVPPNSCASGSGVTGSGGLVNHARLDGGSGALLNPAMSVGVPGKSGASSGAGRSSSKLTQQQLIALIAKVHNAPGKLGPIVTNPAATQANQSLLGQLQQQKQIALAERNQAPLSPGTTPSGSAPPASNLRIAPVRAPLSTAAAPAPSTPVNRLAVMTPSNITASCATFHGPAITTISGQQGSSAVLTQDPQYNLVTIRGCNFGQGKGQAQLNSAERPEDRESHDRHVDRQPDHVRGSHRPFRSARPGEREPGALSHQWTASPEIRFALLRQASRTAPRFHPGKCGWAGLYRRCRRQPRFGKVLQPLYLVSVCFFESHCFGRGGPFQRGALSGWYRRLRFQQAEAGILD